MGIGWSIASHQGTIPEGRGNHGIKSCATVTLKQQDPHIEVMRDRWSETFIPSKKEQLLKGLTHLSVCFVDGDKRTPTAQKGTSVVVLWLL